MDNLGETRKRKLTPVDDVYSLWNQISPSMTEEESRAISAHPDLLNIRCGLETIINLPPGMSKLRLERIRHALLFDTKLEQLSKEDYLDNDLDPALYQYHDSDPTCFPEDRNRLFSLIFFLHKILGAGHALYRLPDMLAYSPRSQLFLGMNKLCEIPMFDDYSFNAKLACIDSLVESNEIAYLRARTIIYFHSASLLSDQLIHYLSMFEISTKSNEHIYDQIFMQLSHFKYRHKDWLDLVFSHTNPEKLLLGLKIIAKQHSPIEHDPSLSHTLTNWVLKEQSSPEILADIITRLGKKALSIQIVLQELERLLTLTNQDLQEYQSYYAHQKSKVDEEHNMFMRYIESSDYLLHLEEKELDNYFVLQAYLEKIHYLEYLGEKSQTYQEKLTALNRCFGSSKDSPDLRYIENKSYLARLTKLDNPIQILLLRLQHLKSLIIELPQNIGPTPSRRSPLLGNCKWSHDTAENKAIHREELPGQNSPK